MERIVQVPLVEGVALTNSEEDHYMVPYDAISAQIARVSLINTGAAEALVTVYTIPEGSTSGVANTILSQVPVGPSGIPQHYDMKKVMKPGTTITTNSDTADVVAMHVDGVETYDE